MIDAEKEQEAMALFVHGQLYALHQVAYEYNRNRKWKSSVNFFMYVWNKISIFVELKAGEMHIASLSEMKGGDNVR